MVNPRLSYRVPSRVNKPPSTFDVFSAPYRLVDEPGPAFVRRVSFRDRACRVSLAETSLRNLTAVSVEICVVVCSMRTSFGPHSKRAPCLDNRWKDCTSFVTRTLYSQHVMRRVIFQLEVVNGLSQSGPTKKDHSKTDISMNIYLRDCKEKRTRGVGMGRHAQGLVSTCSIEGPWYMPK